MEFNFNQQHNQVYHTPSSMYTYFSDQKAVKEGFWNGRSMDRGVEILRGSMDSREEIQIELEKEIIREQIVAKEIVRLKEELRRGMTMDNGGGFIPTFRLNNRLEPRAQPEELRRGMTMDNGGGFIPTFRLNNRLEPRAQPVSFEEKYGGIGRRRQEIEGFEMGYLNGSAPAPRAAAGSQSCGLREGQWAWG